MLFVHSTRTHFSEQCSLCENPLKPPTVYLWLFITNSSTVGWKINAYWTAAFSHVFVSHAWMRRLHRGWSVDGCISFTEKHISVFYRAVHSSFVPPLDIRLLLRMICQPLKEGQKTEWPTSCKAQINIWNGHSWHLKHKCISIIRIT